MIVARGKVQYRRKRQEAVPREEAPAYEAERLLDLLERVLDRVTGARQAQRTAGDDRSRPAND